MLQFNDSVQKEKHKGTFKKNETWNACDLEQMMVSTKYSVSKKEN